MSSLSGSITLALLGSIGVIELIVLALLLLLLLGPAVAAGVAIARSMGRGASHADPFTPADRAIMQPKPLSPRSHRRRAKRGKGLPPEELARRIGLTIDELLAVPRDYYESHIPKRSGGARTLHVPNRKLKLVQRRILRKLLANLRTHPAATGFEPGKSIVHNALPHANRDVVIKLDIVDFFPTTSDLRVEAYFRRIGWDADAAALLTALTTHEGGLPQGAPTSPRLSNLVNHALDARIGRYVRKHHGTYTRYADDITVSYPSDYPKYVRGTIQRVRRVAKGHGYVVHTKKKLRVARRHQQQRVTGLVVNEKVQLTRAKRRQLRAIEHRLRTTGRATMTEQQLRGWQSLQAMIAAQTAEAKRQ